MVGPFDLEKAQGSLGKAAEGLRRATDGLGKTARSVSSHVADQASTAQQRMAALAARAPDPYDGAVAEYNGAFTEMSDAGMTLLRQRERTADLVELVEDLVNSVANTPKSFAVDIAEITLQREAFLESEEFARTDLIAARHSAAGAGAGFAAGAAVASLAPTAAMWAATTFGTASTGTAISTLSGAAATQASLAWLGGGALAAGGGGTAAGGALLALAGPIGWTIAGATLLTSIVLFTKKKTENREAKEAALAAVQENTAAVRGLGAQIMSLLHDTTALRERLRTQYGGGLTNYGADFLALPAEQQTQLATLVNNTLSAAALLSQRIAPEPGDE